MFLGLVVSQAADAHMWWQKKEAVVQPAAIPEIDRYKIVNADGFVFMLDTITGTSWRYVRVNKDDKNPISGGALSFFWSLNTKFDDDYSEIRHMNYLDTQKVGYKPPPQEATPEELEPEQ